MEVERKYIRGPYSKRGKDHAGYKHGQGPLYSIWAGMINRCHNPNNKDYSYYGERGIKVCKRWRKGADGIHPFILFQQDMGPRPTSKHSIDRCDNDGWYRPSNCRWATRRRQLQNTSRTIWILYEDKLYPLSVACRKAGVSYSRCRHHIMYDLEPQEAFDYARTTPPHSRVQEWRLAHGWQSQRQNM